MLNYKKFLTTASSALICIAALSSSTSYAGSGSSIQNTLNVGATAESQCSISAAALSFDGYAGAEMDRQTTITPKCNMGVSYTIKLSAGSSANEMDRTVRIPGPGGAALYYRLALDSGFTQLWGDFDFYHYTGTGTGDYETIPVYGRMLANPLYQPGTYSDVVNIILSIL